jgi:hypothetical protein
MCSPWRACMCNPAVPSGGQRGPYSVGCQWQTLKIQAHDWWGHDAARMEPVSNFEGSAGYQHGDCGWYRCLLHGIRMCCQVLGDKAICSIRLAARNQHTFLGGSIAGHHLQGSCLPMYILDLIKDHLATLKIAVNLLKSRTCSGQLQWPDDMQCDGLHSAVAVAQPRPRWHISLCNRLASVRYTHPICMHDMTSVTSIRLRAGNQIAQHTFAWPAAP